jgi:hypothetical protein
MRTLNKLPRIGFILIGAGLLFEIAKKASETTPKPPVVMAGYCNADTIAVSVMLTGVGCIVIGTIIKILLAKK